MPRTLPCLVAALILAAPLPALVQGLGYGPTAPSGAAPAAPPHRHVHIATVHLDGITGLTATAAHPAEAFPAAAMPAGGGLLLSPPDAEGTWRMRAFLFQPAQIVVREGETLTLTFVGVQGPVHRIEVEGQGEPFTLRRGELRSLTFTPDRPGRIAYRSLDRLPSMTGEILVLPRP
jgi:plastocyanin